MEQHGKRIKSNEEALAAFVRDNAEAVASVLNSGALREAFQAALQEIQANTARPLDSFASVAAHMEGADGKNRYRVGDVIRMRHDDFGLIQWRVIGVDVDQAAGSKHTLTVATEHIEAYRWFANPNEDHPMGGNHYMSSAIRFYLNHDFFSGMPEEDAETVMITCRPCTEHNEASSAWDRVWLLSASEVGLEGAGIPHEGKTYPWYTQEDGKEQRKAMDMHSAKAAYWLRTPSTVYDYFVRSVSKGGSLGHISAYDRGGVLAACVIGSKDTDERRNQHE
ncbi:MAG: DUF6273 domain-containing protein [Clostridia bacterium]|nr:DUF6273 domain-containing protein [Clostridia bacterium]